MAPASWARGAGRVGGAVVDDEDVGVGQALAHLSDHGGDGVGLVPGRDEDQSSHRGDSPTPAPGTRDAGAQSLC